MSRREINSQMATAHVTLTEQESATLSAIALEIGKTPDELIHEAVAQFLLRSRQSHRATLLRQACGMWQDRTDLPELESLRSELDRF
jgi:hypothetical protein